MKLPTEKGRVVYSLMSVGLDADGKLTYKNGLYGAAVDSWLL